MVHDLRALYAKLVINTDGQILATLQVKPMLTEQIKAVAQNDNGYLKLMEEALDGKKPEFSLNDEGMLLYQGRMCIPNDVGLK